MFESYADYLLPGKQALYLCVDHSFEFNRFASMWHQNRILFNRLSTNLKRKRWLQLPSYHYMRTMYIRIKQHELASLSSCSIKKWFSQCCYFFGIFLMFRNIFRELVFYESPSPPPEHLEVKMASNKFALYFHMFCFYDNGYKTKEIQCKLVWNNFDLHHVKQIPQHGIEQCENTLPLAH